jgi:aspartate oxidase
MEFMQFHPTCLYNLEVKNFLITEAVRGEGGHLKIPPGFPGGGERFMPRFDPREELAPRDVVAAPSTTRSSAWGWTMSTSTSATRIQTSFAATFPTSTSGCSAWAST